MARLFAIARLYVGSTLRNIQASWVKDGITGAAALLGGGANDLGGTLMNESISSAAGAEHGEFQSPATLRGIARLVQRPPAERDTLYRVLKHFPASPTGDEAAHEPLSHLADPATRFAMMG